MPKPDAAGPRAAPPPSPVEQFVPVKRSRLWRGIALDLTVVVANLFLLAPLARLLRAEGQGFLAEGHGWGAGVSHRVGWLFLAVFAAHALGAYLKLGPRQARAAGGTIVRFGAPDSQLDGVSERTRRRRLRERVTWSPPPHKVLVLVACALLLFHFTIFLLLLFTGWQGAGLDGWVSVVGDKGSADGTFLALLVRFVLICFILPLPTALVGISLGSGDGDAPLVSWRTHWATELLADLLLYFSIVVITVIMNVLIAPRFASVPTGAERTFGDVLASLIPMALAFSIFYLPPRLIYLAEDYRSPLTWLTILLALLSLAYRTFFPANTFSW